MRKEERKKYYASVELPKSSGRSTRAEAMNPSGVGMKSSVTRARREKVVTLACQPCWFGFEDCHWCYENANGDLRERVFNEEE